jgi:hypothetical protein
MSASLDHTVPSVALLLTRQALLFKLRSSTWQSGGLILFCVETNDADALPIPLTVPARNPMLHSLGVEMIQPAAETGSVPSCSHAEEAESVSVGENGAAYRNRTDT